MKKKLLIPAIPALLFGLLAYIHYVPGDVVASAADLPRYTSFTAHKASPPAGMELSIINTGTNVNSEGLAVGGGDMTKKKESKAVVVFIKHPRGNIFYDAGLGRDHAEHMQGITAPLRPMFHFGDLNPAVDQLKAQGMGPSDVSKIFLSHIHFDHAGGLEDFPGVKIMVTQNEFDKGHSGEFGFVKSQYDAPNMVWENFKFTNKPFENFEKSYDIYGDGSLVLVSMPGHTPGSTGLFVTLPSGKRYFFIGDAVWSLQGAIRLKQKPLLASMLVDGDRHGLQDNILRIHYLMKKYSDLQIVPAHEAAILDKIAQFPIFEK